MSELVEITGIASGGAGVGRLRDGRAVFVHRTALGDRVRVKIVEHKKSWARGRLESIEQPGPGRREAPCVHYGKCGGCTLEHLEYQVQLAAKTRLVHDALSRIGKLDTEVPQIVGSPQEFRYRNRVSFTLLRLTNRVVAGFHELERPGRIIDIGAACLLPEEAIATAWGALRDNWGTNAERLPAGSRLRLTLRASAEGAVSLVIEGGRGAGQPDEMIALVPGLQSIWHRPRPELALNLLAGEKSLPESWHDDDMDVSGTVFLQVNRDAAALLEEHVIGLAGDVAGNRVVDAYCGVGLHARRLARLGAIVTGIELDALAIEQARAGAPENATFVQGRVESALPAALPAQLVIVNPPRAGLHEQAARVLRQKPPSRLIYVSCDPATLARDLDRMRAAYELRSIRCFDLFPQTAHVETVVELACVTT